jgi:acylphosphatase
MTNRIQLKVNITGRVQGVYYRVETKNMADRLGVKGYVKNLSNGSVEAVFKGDSTAVHQMTDWCRKGPAAAAVDNVQTQQTDTVSNFQAFEITY